MSQTAVGERLEITFQQLQKNEWGINRIGASRLYKLSQILDVPIGYFFEDLPDDWTCPECGASQDQFETVD